MWPSPTPFQPGESLEVVVQAGDVVTGVLPGHRVTRNAGDHVISAPAAGSAASCSSPSSRTSNPFHDSPRRSEDRCVPSC
ncbi:hypothetical protein [Streptomyces sp. CSDS2]|uniref:hypothetical protein n=1 Tax=Streptomyces sp. CSDS2 TaxID=3055051 RepID=UPI00339D3641